MPIIIPNGLSVSQILRETDGIDVMERENAERQDIRAQEYAIVNLMPTQVKERTVRQLARLLGHTSLQVNPTLIHVGARLKDDDDPLSALYKPWKEMKEKQFDGLIVTGAPIEHLDWNDVTYWDELRSIIDWSRTNVTSRLFICWGAQAALHHLYGHEKSPLAEKAFGVFPHTLENDNHPLITGFDDEFFVPVSRHTEIPLSDLRQNNRLEILSTSPDTGAYLAIDKNGRDTFVFNHPEYGKSSLGNEYRRDRERGDTIKVPANYFRNDNPDNAPINRWKAHARILYDNWLKLTYQRSPFKLEEIQSLPESIPSSAKN